MVRHLASSVVSDFCVLSGLPGEYDDEIRDLGGQVHYCPRDLRFPFRFRATLRRGGYDAVHSNVHISSGGVLRLARDAGVATRIAQFHSIHDGRGRNPARRLWRHINRRMLDSSATAIIGVSESVTAANWPGHRTDPRCLTIHNGLDLSRFGAPPDRTAIRRSLAVPRDAELVLHVGNQRPQKNTERVVAVFLELLSQRPGAVLLLVGREDPEIAATLRRRAAAAGAADRVRLLGSRIDVPELMSAADALLFPSRSEGFPGVVMEAVAAGLPVLASDISPHREVAALVPGITLLPLSDDDRTWAAELERILAAPRPDRLAALAAMREHGLTAEAVAGRYLALWRGVSDAA